MANTSSAKKAFRQTIQRTTANKARRTQMKSEVRRVEEAIAAGDKTTARAALVVAEPVLMRTAQKGIVHKNAASRKVMRLSARIKALPN